MYRSALLTILGSAALGFASKRKGSFARLEKRDYKVVQLYLQYVVKSYPDEWNDDPPIDFEKVLITGDELGFGDEIDFITIETWFADGSMPQEVQGEYSEDFYRMDVQIHIKKGTEIDERNYFVSLTSREAINSFVRRIEPKIRSILRDMVLKSHPKESIINMPNYLLDSDASKEWHQPGMFETGMTYLPVQFGGYVNILEGKYKNPDLQFFMASDIEVVVINGKPLEFYKPTRNLPKLRKR
jgi:hypothetical protein